MKKIVSVLFIYYLLSLTSQLVEAQTYSVRPVLPNNQRVGVTNYFDLTLLEEEQTIIVEISNEEKHERQFKLTLTNATTNNQGSIQYGSPEKRDSSLATSLTDLSESPGKVVVPGKSKKTFPITIEKTSPLNKGVILGGIVIKPLLSNEEKERVASFYIHTIAVLLREADNEQLPEFKLLTAEVNDKVRLRTRIQNSQAAIAENMTVTWTVKDVETEDVLYREQKTGLTMAPNSTLDMSLELNQELTSKNYFIDVAIKQNNQVQNLHRKLTTELPKNIKKTSETRVQPGGILKKLLIFLLLVSLISYVRWKEKQRNEK